MFLKYFKSNFRQLIRPSKQVVLLSLVVQSSLQWNVALLTWRPLACQPRVTQVSLFSQLLLTFNYPVKCHFVIQDCSHNSLLYILLSECQILVGFSVCLFSVLLRQTPFLGTFSFIVLYKSIALLNVSFAIGVCHI